MRKIFLRQSVVILTGLALVIGAGVAYAYNHVLYSSYWTNNKTSIFYRMQNTFDPLTKTQFENATKAWNKSLPSDFLYKSAFETADNSPGKDGINTVTKNAYGATSFTGEHIPYTNSSGRVIESDIRINSSHVWANSAQPGKYDVQSTLTHELGHALRVGHSSTYADTMYGSASTNTDYKRTPTSDDYQAANDSYDRWSP